MTDNPNVRGRDVTDKNLHDERSKTDDELAHRRADIEASADAVVTRARAKADDVVDAAREQADLRSPGVSEESVRLTAKRHREDHLLAREREIVDHERDVDRAARHRAIAALLEAERESTDTSLRSERRSADAAVASRDDFLGMVSHDLRTLLGNVELSATMLVEEAPRDDAGQQVVQRAEAIQRFVIRMTRLIDDLLDVCSLEAGRLGLVVEKLDASRLLIETLEAFQSAATARGVAISARMVGNAIPARFDHDRILQVLANLVANALKFTEREGRIDVAVDRRAEDVLFSVRDTGPGIAHDDLVAIFDRFWQAPTARRRGLGLGLYISRCIVEAHGGRIWAESQLGRGSTFYFTLPAISSVS